MHPLPVRGVAEARARRDWQLLLAQVAVVAGASVQCGWPAVGGTMIMPVIQGAHPNLEMRSYTVRIV